MQSTATPGVGASLPAQTHIRNVIRNLAIHASIETTARSAQEVDSYVGQVPAGSDIYIAWLPETKWPHLSSIWRLMSGKPDLTLCLTWLRGV